MAGKFEIKSGKTGKFRFNLKASNGQIILSSEAYDSRSAAVKGITSVKKNAQTDKRFERKAAKDGSVYFVLKASNGEPIGKSNVSERCLRYKAPSKCLSKERRHMRFCIDRYEWPNKKGELPALLALLGAAMIVHERRARLVEHRVALR